jgi:hypothetical protein
VVPVTRQSVGLTSIFAIALVAALPAQERVGPTPNLAAVFNTGANIGFSVIRAAYSPPDQPPPQAALDWMLKDLANAKGWAMLVQSCVAFDSARFDNVTRQVNARTPAGQLLPQFEQLYRDYQAAIRGARCNFGLQSPQHVEAFYLGAVFTGFATARASYFHYPTPVPPQVVAQIRQDFAGIRTALPAAAACSGSLASIATRLDEIENRLASAAGQVVYTDIVAVYQAIEASTGSAACAAAPTAPAAGCTAESLVKTTCAAVCKGATVMLGVVSGGPECQACIAKGCK